jgi:cytoskeleton protein RodZ
MQAIGERLREARMRQGLDISEVETATKIRGKYLRALENDEFSMLPGGTYVKSFLRTYAEYLGLDAHLLVEEYRVEHEPRGMDEMQALAPPVGRAPERRVPRVGPPVGPLGLVVAGVVVLLLVLAVIGLASGGGDDSKKKAEAPAKKHAKKKTKKKHQQAAAAPAKPSRLKLKVVPAETTYVCVDDGRGTKLFEGTISQPQSFHGKQLRINLGISSATLYLNGKRVPVKAAPGATVGLAFSRSGKATDLPVGQRPCA